ncbi:EamA family transporter [Photorhabdus africana]|uniref:EamA family transporter n=1 Tax=Photorhabdus africana TaxID=3097554 RepID=UPI002B411C89|nr:EamA family transporter [Photorhabdus sp. CRI-LC]
MHQYLGYIAAYGWCFVTAFSMLLTSEVSQRLSPFIVCFFTFSLATSAFLIYNASSLSELWCRIREKQVMFPIVGINVSSFISWGLMIYPLTYLQPTLVATLILGINPISSAVITHLFLKQPSPYKLVGISSALFIVIVFLSFRTLLGDNSIPGASHYQIMFSLLCCYLSGIATSVNNILTKKIMENDFGIIDVICMRFYLTILISGIIGFTIHPVTLNQDLVVSILLITLIFVIVPLVLLQVALKQLDPLRVAIISPLMPVLVVLMQLYDGKFSVLPYSTISATLVTWVLVSLGTYWAMRKV